MEDAAVARAAVIVAGSEVVAAAVLAASAAASGLAVSAAAVAGLTCWGLLQIEEVQTEIEALEDQMAEVTALAEEQRGGIGVAVAEEAVETTKGGVAVAGEVVVMVKAVAADLAASKIFPMKNARSCSRQRREEAEALAKANEEKLNLILLPHQMDRLKEIQLQQMGVGALSNADVIAKLAISEDQQEQIRTLQQEKWRSDAVANSRTFPVWRRGDAREDYPTAK